MLDEKKTKNFPSKVDGFPVNEHGRVVSGEHEHGFVHGYTKPVGDPEHSYNLQRHPIVNRHSAPQLVVQTLLQIEFNVRTQVPLDKMIDRLQKLKERYEAEGYTNIRWEVDFERTNEHRLVGDRLETPEETHLRQVYEKGGQNVSNLEWMRLQKKYGHDKVFYLLEDAVVAPGRDEGLHSGVTFEIKKIGSQISVAQFNKGYSHIVVDDGCWIIMNGRETSSWIFDEAVQVLKQLPNSPSDYKPYTDWVYNIRL